MSKSVEEFKKIMESDRGEKAYYEAASPTDTINVPITREGFETLLKRACDLMSIPVTMPLRNVFVGFLHHIENSVCTTSIQAIGATCFKAMSNHCSYEIDQEIKKQANLELEEERQKLRDAAAAAEKAKKLEAAEQKRNAKQAKKGFNPAKQVEPAANEKAQ